jgi:hypothetical protein
MPKLVSPQIQQGTVHAMALETQDNGLANESMCRIRLSENLAATLVDMTKKRPSFFTTQRQGL